MKISVSQAFKYPYAYPAVVLERGLAIYHDEIYIFSLSRCKEIGKEKINQKFTLQM